LSDIFELSTVLSTRLKNEIPNIITLINSHYENETKTRIVLPKRYLTGIRSTLLDLPAIDMPVICSGLYQQNPLWEGEQQFSRKEYHFMIQVWLAERDEGVIYEQAALWADALEYFVQEEARYMVKGAKAPESPDIDISNSEDDGNGYFRQIVQAAGRIHITN
jgi:hypothetical protein